jgi:SAM-dependent methyltransferase
MKSSKKKKVSLNDIFSPSFWVKLSSQKEGKFSLFLKKDFWELIASDYDELEKTPFYKSMQEDILLEMEKRGALKENFTFFDVACGTGNYTIKVAPKVSKVYALDISPSMLEILRKKIKEKNLQNVEVIEADWRKYKPEMNFDTVFVSMTPILRDLKEVKRLFDVAKKFLIIVNWAGLRKNMLLEEIEKKFFKKNKGDKNPGILLIFNYFYTLGYPVDIKFYEGYFERKSSLEKIWKRFNFRLTSMGYTIGPKKEREILEFLREKENNGFIETKTLVRIGAMFINKEKKEI